MNRTTLDDASGSISDGSGAGGTARMDPVFASERRARLGRYLSAYWLRPENALWMTLRSLALTRCRINAPSIDVSCGDGLFSFLHAGGRLDPAFDVFSAVADLDRVTDEHVDMFDTCDARYAPRVLGDPEFNVNIGSDQKVSMLRRAAALRFYDELVEHDNNHVMPFEEDAFATVYCNAAYWVRDIDGFLRELCRVARPGAHVILQVKLSRMAEYTLERFRPVLGDRFLDVISRGRLHTWPTLATRSQWERRFRQAGFDVLDAYPFVTRTHAHVWDIGLRPIAPLLVRMANALTPRTRAEIKRDWVALCAELLEPLCDPGLDLTAGDGPAEPAEIQYVLTA